MFILFWLFSWPIVEAIKSWKAKDENYRLDCIVLPIAAAIFGIGAVVCGLGWLLSPQFR